MSIFEKLECVIELNEVQHQKFILNIKMSS